MSGVLRLSELKIGQRGRVRKLEETSWAKRLLDMGFQDGSAIEKLIEGPWFADPCSYRIRGSIVALRKAEADLVWVEVQEQ